MLGIVKFVWENFSIHIVANFYKEGFLPLFKFWKKGEDWGFISYLENGNNWNFVGFIGYATGKNMVFFFGGMW